MKIAVVIVCLLMIQGCAVTVGDDNASKFIPDSDVRYTSRVKSVAMFYEGSQVNQKYSQIGLIEAQGNKRATTQDVLNHLKVKGLKIGADAIINVKRVDNSRNQHELFSDDEDIYSSITYQGVAVRFTDLEALPQDIKQKLERNDYAAESAVKRDNKRESDNTAFEMVFSVIIGLAYVLSL